MRHAKSHVGKGDVGKWDVGMSGCWDVGNGVEQEKSWEMMRRGRLGVGVCL